MSPTKTRRRVASFTTKARALLDAADWPEGVKVVVDSQTSGDAVHVYKEGGGGRVFWYLDARYLESADPAEVRKTAIRRLESQGRDPKYSDKSRAEDLALAALLGGSHDVVPCGHPPWEHLACCLMCGRDVLWVSGDGVSTPEVYRHVEEGS